MPSPSRVPFRHAVGLQAPAWCGIAQNGRMASPPGIPPTRAQTATLLMRFQSAFAKEP